MTETKIIDMLSESSVSIITKKIIEMEGVSYEIGDPHRCAYTNNIMGREQIQVNEPENIVTAVFAIWGDSPKVFNEEVTV